MSIFFRDLKAYQVEQFADEWARQHVQPAFDGDANSAELLSITLSNQKRGPVARAMWEGKVPREAFRAYLSAVWLHAHRSVIAAAETRRRLNLMFRYARFELPLSLPETVGVWRGTWGLGLADAVQGPSWTTDRDVACWFALRFGAPEPPLVVAAQVPRAEILFFSDQRDEREVVLARRPTRAIIDGELHAWELGHARVLAAKQRNLQQAHAPG